MDEEKSKKRISKHSSTSEVPNKTDLDTSWASGQNIWFQTGDDRDIGQMVLDLIPDAVMYMDTGFHIVWANRKALQDAGLYRHEMYGNICYQIRWGLDVPCSDCPCMSVMQTVKPHDSLIEDCDGRVRIRRVVPVLDQNEAVKGIVEIFSDLEKMWERNPGPQPLENQALEKLTNILGREFGQIFMGIKGNVSLAYLDLPIRSTARGYLENIEKSSQQALETLKCISTYPGLGKHLLQHLDLSLIMENTIETYRKKLPAGVTLHCNFKKQLPPVEADGSQIRKLVRCIFDNAMDALRGRGGELSISTGIWQVDAQELENPIVFGSCMECDYVYLKVADTGCGMNETVKAKMFEPFFTTKKGARGLGLTAVAGIVRNLGGVIRVTSTEQVGTIFEILLKTMDPITKIAEIET